MNASSFNVMARSWAVRKLFVSRMFVPSIRGEAVTIVARANNVGGTIRHHHGVAPDPGALAAGAGVKLFQSRSNLHHAISASWFETRGVAALLTMRVQDLIPA
jgi:hypothetical protein